MVPMQKTPAPLPVGRGKTKVPLPFNQQLVVTVKLYYNHDAKLYYLHDVLGGAEPDKFEA